MSDKINLMQRASEIEISPIFDGVTKLVCHITDESEMVSGTDTGYTLEFSNPLMTQETLDAMMEKIRGYQYQPYRVDGAMLDPAAEMGDAISTQKMSGGLFSRSRDFGKLMKADISAPTDQEIEHEYKFETKEERNVRRQVGGFKASLQVLSEGISAEAEERTAMGDELQAQLDLQATAIEAKVSSDTSGNRSTFGWKLTDSSWEVYGNNNTVLKATQSGLEVTGKITATSGVIGGFTIGTNDYNEPALYTGSAWKYDGVAKGVHLSVRGIRLGTKFKVDEQGVVNATDMYLQGSLYFYDKNKSGSNKWYSLSVANVRKGIEESYDNYSTWSTGSGYGYDYNGACARYVDGPSVFTCGTIGVKSGQQYYYFSSGVNITVGAHSYTVLGFEN